MKIVQRYVVAEVSIEPVGLLYQDDPDAGRLLQEREHPSEAGASCLLRGFDVDELLDDVQVMVLRVLVEKPLLSRDRESLTFLLNTRNSRVEDGLAPHIRLWAIGGFGPALE